MGGWAGSLSSFPGSSHFAFALSCQTRVRRGLEATDEPATGESAAAHGPGLAVERHQFPDLRSALAPSGLLAAHEIGDGEGPGTRLFPKGSEGVRTTALAEGHVTAMRIPAAYGAFGPVCIAVGRGPGGPPGRAGRCCLFCRPQRARAWPPYSLPTGCVFSLWTI